MRIPGLEPAANCGLCGVHWRDHARDIEMKCFTVTGPGGGWINSHSGGPAGWSQHKARMQAESLEAHGNGKHTIEVRTYLGFHQGYSREYDVIR